MGLVEDLERAAEHAGAHANGARVSAVLATEPEAGRRVYLVALDDPDRYRSWLALREDGTAVVSRTELRQAVSIAALCELAADSAGGGDLGALSARLAEIGAEEDPPAGIEEAEDAARALVAVVGEPPQLASPARLDAIGQATRRLEQELDPLAPSPFATAMRSAEAAVGELQREIEAGYRLPLE
jgi:hypothetical protein